MEPHVDTGCGKKDDAATKLGHQPPKPVFAGAKDRNGHFLFSWLYIYTVFASRRCTRDTCGVSLENFEGIDEALRRPLTCAHLKYTVSLWPLPHVRWTLHLRLPGAVDCHIRGYPPTGERGGVLPFYWSAETARPREPGTRAITHFPLYSRLTLRLSRRYKTYAREFAARLLAIQAPSAENHGHRQHRLRSPHTCKFLDSTAFQSKPSQKSFGTVLKLPWRLRVSCQKLAKTSPWHASIYEYQHLPCWYFFNRGADLGVH